MKSILMSTIAVLASMNAFAQNTKADSSTNIQDSLKFEYYRLAAIKYPTIRQASLSTELYFPAKVTSKLPDQDLFKGKAQLTRIKGHFTAPITSWGKNSLSATIGFAHDKYELSDVTNPGKLLGISNMKMDFTTLNLSANFSRTDSLFNHPVTYSVLLNTTTDASFSQIRLSALGFATMNLIRTPLSSLSLGIAVIGDKSALVPAYLLINYSRKFPVAGLELLVDIPQRVSLRKELTSKTFLTAGSELGGTMFFFSLKEPNLPSNAISTALNIRSGLTLEHMVSKSVILGLSAGVMSTPMTKALGSRSTQSDYLIKTKTGNAPYVNFSISVLPVWRGFRR